MSGNVRKMQAAQAEIRPQPKNITFKGRRFKLPAQIPFEVTWQMPNLEGQDGMAVSKAIIAILQALLGEDLQGFRDLKPAPSMDDASDLIGAIFEAYGTSAGEASASPVSS